MAGQAVDFVKSISVYRICKSHHGHIYIRCHRKEVDSRGSETIGDLIMVMRNEALP
jgi:hypothetical protein